MKLKGVKKVCGETRNINPGSVLQIVYDVDNRDVYTLEHAGWNSWTQFDPDDNQVTCGFTDKYLSMETITGMVLDAIRINKK